MYTRRVTYATPEEREAFQHIANDDQVPSVGISKDGKVIWRIKPQYRTIEDVRRRNERNGGKFFSPDTRVQERIYVAKDGRAFFVTSERDRDADRQPRRLYSVRVAELNGSINTVGDFQAYETGRAAHAAARKAAQS